MTVADYPGRIWLPAKNLQLGEEWSKDPDTLRAGEPVTRTLRLRAVGLSAEQLPEISVTIAEGMKEYGDQPITRTTTDNDWVNGVREQRIALVPGNQGTYTLPEIRIDWWDTERDAPRQTTIPARILRVATGIQDAVATIAGGDAVSKEQQPTASLWQRSPLWQGVSAVLLLLWFVTLVAWRRAVPQATGAGRDKAQNPPQRPPASLRRRSSDALP